jgi:glucan phosphoethanolaminetransferase (alkaline phosphatase superfamily)
MYFTGTFLTRIMLENTVSFNALGSTKYFYIMLIFVSIAISFLPFRVNKEIVKSIKCKWILVCVNMLYFAIIIFALHRSVGIDHSPYLSVAKLTKVVFADLYQEQKYRMAARAVKDNIYEEFYSELLVTTEGLKPVIANKKPNVVLIFTEGMSAEVIDVYDDLTPNINQLIKKSLAFENYYNHTAATFRGLRGQLFSGYQFKGGYSYGTGFGELAIEELQKGINTKLISIAEILNDEGYNSYFLNPEPSYPQFTNYLRQLGFSHVISGDISDRDLSDREIFTLLEKTVLDVKEPFFIAMYNIGTHDSRDSPDEKYQDGKNAMLNKFHNYDKWFGTFFNNIFNSQIPLRQKIADNTILIFTADHATFPGPEYVSTFASTQQFFVGKVPLMFYNKDIVPEHVDVSGRNSLCLTPTILDILNIREYENYFLGSSLFSDGTTIEKISALGEEYFYTGCTNVLYFPSGYDNEINKIKRYYTISTNFE